MVHNNSDAVVINIGFSVKKGRRNLEKLNKERNLSIYREREHINESSKHIVPYCASLVEDHVDREHDSAKEECPSPA